MFLKILKKSANERPCKKTDEQKKETLKLCLQKSWTCPDCDEVLKNHSRQYRGKKI